MRVILYLFVLLVNTHALASLENIAITDFVYFENDASVNSPEQALASFNQAAINIKEFQPAFNVGNVDQYFWFHSKLENRRAQPVSLHLLAAVPYRQMLHAYIIDNVGNVKVILQQQAGSKFSEREQVSDTLPRWLVSSQFEVAAGASLNVLLHYRSLGSSYLPLEILSQQQLLQRVYSDSLNAALFYSFSFAAILLFLLFGIAIQDKTSVLYAGLFSIALLTLSAMEGYAFMYLWPNLPSWNHHSALFLIYFFCAFGFYVAFKAVEPSLQKQYLPAPILKLFAWFSMISLLMAVLTLFLPYVLMQNISNLFVILMFFAHAVTIVSWFRHGSKQIIKRNIIAVVSAIIIVLAVIVLILWSFVSSLDSSQLYVQSSRIIFILAGLATMATIIAHVNGLRQDYAASLEQQVNAVKREAAINHQLYVAEQNYSRVRLLATQSQQQLEEASHDMKQPLFSLRSTLDAVMQDQTTQVKQQVQNAFSYLESLCVSYMQSSRVSNQELGNETLQTEVAQVEQPYKVNLVLKTVFRMFAADASTNNINLRMTGSSIEITLPPTIVIRIISNMVSNAIKHAGECKILLGVRRKPEMISIVVVDNGVGIDDEILHCATVAYKKGAASCGEGLGLAICKRLAQQHAMQLEIASKQGQGTCCQLHIPLHSLTKTS